jgi:hypothetical protein
MFPRSIHPSLVDELAHVPAVVLDEVHQAPGLCPMLRGLLNVAPLARNLSVEAMTAHSYIDLLCNLLLVRRLQPWPANLGKRLRSVSVTRRIRRGTTTTLRALSQKPGHERIGMPMAHRMG